ncbi:MAG: 30S ribosomal protein THX [Dokdonella sp.]
MGRGDRKTKKGKISIRSYGNVRPHSVKSAAGDAAAKPTSKPAVKKVAPAIKKAPAKKTA